jgi:hypothetical protein
MFHSGEVIAWNKFTRPPNILISTPSLVTCMSINQFTGLYIMAVITVFIFTVTAIPVSIAQVSPENEQESEGEAGDLSLEVPGNQGGNTSSDREGEVEYRAGEGPRILPFGNITQGNTTDLADDEYEFE